MSDTHDPKCAERIREFLPRLTEYLNKASVLVAILSTENDDYALTHGMEDLAFSIDHMHGMAIDALLGQPMKPMTTDADAKDVCTCGHALCRCKWPRMAQLYADSMEIQLEHSLELERDYRASLARVVVAISEACTVPVPDDWHELADAVQKITEERDALRNKREESEIAQARLERERDVARRQLLIADDAGRKWKERYDAHRHVTAECQYVRAIAELLAEVETLRSEVASSRRERDDARRWYAEEQRVTAEQAKELRRHARERDILKNEIDGLRAKLEKAKARSEDMRADLDLAGDPDDEGSGR